jgi:type I restriction enzyme S subunit
MLQFSILKPAFPIEEYRTRLIADVVTGKLDVRAAAAALPETIEEPQELDSALDAGEEDDSLEDADESEVEEAV